MKLLKFLKEKVIENQEIFKVIKELMICDSNGNEVDFRKVNNSEKNFTIVYNGEKPNLINRIYQNFSYSILYKNTNLISTLNKLSYEERKANMFETLKGNAQTLQALVFFIKEGQKIISLNNSSLIEQFRNTKIDNINFQDINFFLDFFYISVETTIDDVYIDGIFIENQKDSLELKIIYLKKEYSGNKVFETIGSLQCVIKKEGKVEDSFKNTMEEFKKINEAQASLNYISTDIEKENMKDKAIIEFSFKICINTILFFNQIKDKSNSNYEVSEIDGTLSQDKIKDDKNYSKYISNTNYNYYLKNNSKQSKDLTNYEKSRKITQQFIVSGHYRKQPYGNKAEEQKYKIIWIEPYLKGLEFESPNTLKNTIL